MVWIINVVYEYNLYIYVLGYVNFSVDFCRLISEVMNFVV